MLCSAAVGKTAWTAATAQAHKALLAHTRERDAWKQEAERACAESRKLKDRLEEMAYKVNGMAAGTF